MYSNLLVLFKNVRIQVQFIIQNIVVSKLTSHANDGRK